MSRTPTLFSPVVVLLILSYVRIASGCATVAATGAGAAAGIAFTDKGASASVKGDVDEIEQRAREVLDEMKIQVTSTQTEKSGNERELDGKTGDTDVSISMVGAAEETTEIEVTAREGVVKWNKDFAKQIITKIVEKG